MIERCVFYLVLVCFASIANAEIYKWTDKDGRVHYSSSPPEKHPTQTLDIPDHSKGARPQSVERYLYPLNGNVKKTGSLKKICDPVASRATILKRGIPVDSEMGQMLQKTMQHQCKLARKAGVKQSGVYEVTSRGRVQLFPPQHAADLELLTISIFIFKDVESLRKKFTQVRQQPRVNAPRDPVYLIAGASNSASAFMGKDTALVQIDLMANKVQASTLLNTFAKKYHAWLMKEE